MVVRGVLAAGAACTHLAGQRVVGTAREFDSERRRSATSGVGGLRPPYTELEL